MSWLSGVCCCAHDPICADRHRRGHHRAGVGRHLVAVLEKGAPRNESKKATGR
jgi:hypothetical protein